MNKTASIPVPFYGNPRNGAGIRLVQYGGDDYSWTPPPAPPSLPEINQHMQPKTHHCSVSLILLMDESGSIPASKWQLQWAATADALMHPDVLDAIRQVKGIAVMARSFDESSRTRTAWHVLETPQDVARFAAILKAPHHQYDGGTEIGRAVTESMPYFQVSPCRDAKEVIDVSTDGESSKSTMEAAREIAEQRGITINGIAVDGVSATSDIAYAALKQHQVTNDGMTWKSDWSDYARMMRLKLIQEIAQAGGLRVDENGRIVPNNSKAADYDTKHQMEDYIPGDLPPLQPIVPTRGRDESSIQHR